ncbi:MAG TPA: CRTAC1 family protein [Myxococcales bacterium]|nr:CRTAC1 family protein [Myxococcales bacterium]
MDLRGKRLPISAALVAAAAAAAALAYFARPRPKFDMVAELSSIAAREGIWDNQWDQHEAKIRSLSDSLKRETSPPRRFQLEREIAQQDLYAGEVESAIATLEGMAKEFGKAMPADAAEAIKADLAFAWLRMGELQNCATRHNAESCLFPIQGKGVHTQRLGATESVRLYGELLADPKIGEENALSYRWLLNIGYMTLGQYPDQVPERWLIPPSAFQSEADVGRFQDVAAERGVAEFGEAGGTILEDFDNDGHLDLMLSHMGVSDQLQFFHNNGDGKFVRRTEQAGLEGIVGGLNMVQADYDNDGCIDVFLPRGAWLHDHGKFPRSLLRNNCDGTFTDVTAKAGLLSYYPTQAAAWADIDGDGLLDLFVGNEINREQVQWPESTPDFQLYLNKGDGTFQEIGAQSGIRVGGMIKAAVWGDYDNDGRPDLYVSVLGKPNHLFHNLGPDPSGIPRFEDVTEKAGVGEPLMSFTCWFFDYDNDGFLDLFVTGYSATLPNIVREALGQGEQAKGERPRLYHNNGNGTFTDVTRQAGLYRLLLTMGANFGDLDNDGYPDFYLGTGAPPLTTLVPNRMFHNDRGLRFQDVTTSGGFGNLQKGHAVAFGDIDGSGNQDVIENMGGVYPSDRFWTTIYKNPGHPNHWVKLRLTGVKANRFAVGARIRIVASEEGKPREIHGVVGSGGSFGASSLRPHLGLGKAAAIDLLEIRWPGSGRVQQFKGPLPADRIYEIREGDAEARPLAAGLKASARARE